MNKKRLHTSIIAGFLIVTFCMSISRPPHSISAGEGERIANELLKDRKEKKRASRVKNEAEQEAFQEILKVLKRKAEAGDPEAQYQLGRHFDFGRGVERDGIEAAKWYEKAALQNHIKAQHALGLLNTQAKYYVFANPKESVKWFRAAAEQGHASSQHSLGMAYEHGNGVLRNYKEAAKWYQRAAMQGDGMAMHDLAGLYARGLGVPKDLVKAYAWNNVSAAQGWGMAIQYREDLEKSMSSGQIDQAQSLSNELFKKYGEGPGAW